MLKTISGGGRLLFSYEPVNAADLRVTERQMAERRFDRSLILGAANRCRFGCPRVIVCSPLSAEDIPFPTTFWLTCPWLNRLSGTVEANGGVSGLEAWLADNVTGSRWLRFDEDHRLARTALVPPERLDFLRRAKSKIYGRLVNDGIGGTPYDGNAPIRVKCVHLHTASWLSFGRHPAGEWLSSRGLGLECGDGLCAE